MWMGIARVQVSGAPSLAARDSREATSPLMHLLLSPGDFHFYLVLVWGGPGRAAPPHSHCPETRL